MVTIGRLLEVDWGGIRKLCGLETFSAQKNFRRIYKLSEVIASVTRLPIIMSKIFSRFARQNP